jgi:hypothetical protein
MLCFGVLTGHPGLHLAGSNYQLNVMGRDADGRAVLNGVSPVQLDKAGEALVEVQLPPLT